MIKYCWISLKSHQKKNTVLFKQVQDKQTKIPQLLSNLWQWGSSWLFWFFLVVFSNLIYQCIVIASQVLNGPDYLELTDNIFDSVTAEFPTWIAIE